MDILGDGSAGRSGENAKQSRIKLAKTHQLDKSIA